MNSQAETNTAQTLATILEEQKTVSTELRFPSGTEPFVIQNPDTYLVQDCYVLVSDECVDWVIERADTQAELEKLQQALSEETPPDAPDVDEEFLDAAYDLVVDSYRHPSPELSLVSPGTVRQHLRDNCSDILVAVFAIRAVVLERGNKPTTEKFEVVS